MSASEQPTLITLPAIPFLMVDGKGDPNEPDFQEAVGSLYAMSYTIKMMPKKGVTPVGYEPYKVFPLEGLWGVAEGEAFTFALSRELWRWTAMIRQPDFVTQEVLSLAVDMYAQKNKGKKPGFAMRLETFEEGLAVQALHIGPYTEEPLTLKRLDDFCGENGYQMHGRHHEIYLSDPRRTEPSKLKTILRHPVKKI